MNSLSEIAEEIKAHSSFLIFAHENPDGDAFGSAAAAGLLLKKLGKKVSYALSGGKRDYSPILPEAAYFSEPLDSYYECALIVDCSTESYIARRELSGKCSELLVLDHHISNRGHGDMCHVDAGASACGEIIYLLAQELSVSLDREIAGAIYLAIIEDTGRFAYSNTTARTHQIVSELYKIRRDYYLMHDYLDSYELDTLRLIRAAINAIEYHCGTKLGLLCLTRSQCELDYSNMDTDGLVDYVRNVVGCRLAVFIKETSPQQFKVSMRSMAADLDVSLIAVEFGGGGHAKAAGFTYCGEIDTLKAYFIQYTEKKWTD